jgi:hypothetical protein
MTSYDSACKIVFSALFFRRGSDSLQAPPNQGANHPYRAREAAGGCGGAGGRQDVVDMVDTVDVVDRTWTHHVPCPLPPAPPHFFGHFLLPRSKQMSKLQISKNRYYAYRSFYPEIATMKKFRAAGVDTYSVMISNVFNALGTPYTKYPMVWTAKDTYDLDAATAPFRDILKEIPDAKFICLVDLNTPLWWTRYLGAHGARFDSYVDLGRIVSSSLWRRETANYLKVLLRHLDTVLDRRIRAYAFGCGGGTEWQDRNRAGGSLFRLAAFRKWMADKGKGDSVDIPSITRRECGSREFASFTGKEGIDRNKVSYWYGYGDSEVDPLIRNSEHGGLFFDPETDAEVIDYFTFINDEMAGTIDYFLHEAKSVVRPEVELGAIYGYVTSIGQYMLSQSGHLGYEKLLQSPALDFLLAPATDGKMGGGSGSHCVVGSIHAYGKEMLNSSDNKTSTSKGPDGQDMNPNWVTWHDEVQVKAGIKRETAINLINHTSLWFFDMWGGSFSDAAIETVAQCKKIWDEEVVLPVVENSQVLMLVDPKNLMYLNSMHPHCHCFHVPWKMLLSRCGAPFLIASFNDLPKLDMKRFKLVIFCHPFEINARDQRMLDEYVLNQSRHVVWTYGPGIIHDRRWNPEHVKEICGTDFGTPGISKVEKQNWTSVYVYNPDTVTVENLRDIARDAGVLLYCSQPRPVYANERLVAVHTAEVETLKISFPRKCALITELFSGRQYRNTDRLEVTSNGADTWLFRLE